MKSESPTFSLNFDFENLEHETPNKGVLKNVRRRKKCINTRRSTQFALCSMA